MPKSSQTPGSVLLSLMADYQLNPYSLAKNIKLSYSAVRQIISGKTKVTVPTAMRLAKFFGQTSTYWLDLQQNTDLRLAQEDKKLAKVIKGIDKVKKPTAQAKAKAKAKAKPGRKPAGKRKAAPRAKSASRGRKAK